MPGDLGKSMTREIRCGLSRFFRMGGLRPCEGVLAEKKAAPVQRARATHTTPASTTAAPARRGRSRPSFIQRLPMSAEKTMKSSRPATT